MQKFPQAVHRRGARGWVARGVAVAAAVAIGALAGGCSGGPAAAPPPVDPPVLQALPATVQIAPGATGRLRFQLRTALGQPIAQQSVSFAIVVATPADPGAPASDPRGATVAPASALTDGMGVAETTVTGGLQAIFRVRASSSGGSGSGSGGAVPVEAEVVVVVVSSTSGTVLVAPFFPPGSAAAPLVASIDVLFYDDTACAALPLFTPPASPRDPVTLAVSNGRVVGSPLAEFDVVSTAGRHAIVGRGRDGAGGVQALGCVDLTAATLVAGSAVQVALPLLDSDPNPLGTFAVTSRFDFAPPLAVAAAVAAPWRDLQDCPLDPAQLWLDCTVDALSGAQPGDPNDCQPAAATGAEGALGDALAARRGALYGAAASTPGGASCRGPRDGGNGGAGGGGAPQPSLDALVMNLLGSPAPALVAALPAIAADAAQILSTLQLQSRLTVAATAAADVYQATHRFDSAQLTLGDVTSDVALAPLGFPVLQADQVTVIESGGQIDIGPHGITLRLGTVARIAFGQLALAARGLPATSDALVGALAALAHRDDGAGSAQSGCAALDGLLCAEVGRAAGCLGSACADGLASMAALLDAGFNAADGPAIDLRLDAGSAPLLDPHGSGAADRLGDRFATPPQPGQWQATVLSRGGSQSVAGLWDAIRVGD
jgi:hypothetical protein